MQPKNETWLDLAFMFAVVLILTFYLFWYWG